MKHIRFECCYNPQLQVQLTQYFTSLYISQCFSCGVHNVTFMSFGIEGENLLGQFYLNKINITHTTGMFCQGIVLMSDQSLPNEYSRNHILINELYISTIGNGRKCYSFNKCSTAGVLIFVSGHVNETRITIGNSFFKRFHSTAMHIRSKCGNGKNILSL